MGPLLPVQGVFPALADPSGRVDVDLALFPAAAGESPLWAELQRAVPVGPGGAVHLLLGHVKPLPADLFDRWPRWLSIARAGEAPVGPRVPVTGAEVRLARRLARLEEAAGLADPLGVDTRRLLTTLPSRLRGLRDGFDDLHVRMATLEADAPGGQRDLRLTSVEQRLDAVDAPAGRLTRVEDEIDDLVGGPHGDIVQIAERLRELEALLAALTARVDRLAAPDQGV